MSTPAVALVLTVSLTLSLHLSSATFLPLPHHPLFTTRYTLHRRQPLLARSSITHPLWSSHEELPDGPTVATAGYTRFGHEEASEPFSEERGGFSPALSSPMYGIACSNRYCDDKRLLYVSDDPDIGPLFEVSHSDTGDEDFYADTFSNFPQGLDRPPAPIWTDWFSEENEKGKVNFAVCPYGTLVSRVRCSGRYCDNLRLKCRALAFGLLADVEDGDAVVTTDLFSEEGDGVGVCPDTYYVRGIECSGKYCDNLRLLCIRVERL